MTQICLYFQVHQPLRLKRYSIFQIGRDHEYWDERGNREILAKVARKCYLPANELLGQLIKRHEGKFRLAFSLSGVVLDEFARYTPEVLASFQSLAATGCVEFLNETYYHSLAFLYHREEFIRQIERHRQKIVDLFGQEPTTFRNTELIYSNELARFLTDRGYKAVLAEGADKILKGKSPNYLYQVPGDTNLHLLLRNYRLSDDIAFRFSNHQWEGHPLTAVKFARWLADSNPRGDIVNIFIDYETFGEHQWEETGIFAFLDALPGEILKNPELTFTTPQEAARCLSPKGEIDVPDFISWADQERDLTAWQGNAMQKDALNSLYRIGNQISPEDADIRDVWGILQTSDHFYYMCTKWFEDGMVHKYFNPYPSPYDAYINFMNVLDDLESRISSPSQNQAILTNHSEQGGKSIGN